MLSCSPRDAKGRRGSPHGRQVSPGSRKLYLATSYSTINATKRVTIVKIPSGRESQPTLASANPPIESTGLPDESPTDDCGARRDMSRRARPSSVENCHRSTPSGHGRIGVVRSAAGVAPTVDGLRRTRRFRRRQRRSPPDRASGRDRFVAPKRHEPPHGAHGFAPFAVNFAIVRPARRG